MKALTFQIALASTIFNLRITIIILLSHLDIYIYIYIKRIFQDKENNFNFFFECVIIN